MDTCLVSFKSFITSSANSTSRCKRNRILLPLLLLFFCFSLIIPGQAPAKDGALDPSFIIGPGPFAGVQVLPVIRGVAGYPTVTGNPYNGYNLVFGTFWGVNVGTSYSTGNHCIARLRSDGSLDYDFVNNEQLNGEIRGVYIYPYNYPVVSLRNKILIWGRFTAFIGSTFYNNLARLNTDGSLDATFPALNSYIGVVNSVALQGAGGGPLAGETDKIYVGGYNLHASSQEEGPAYQLVRLNYDGTPDSSFTHWGAPGAYVTGISVFLNHPIFANNVRLLLTYPKNDGSGGKYYMLLLDPSVTIPDVSHPPIAFIGDETVDGPIFSIARQSNDGKFVICGQFRNVYNSATDEWVPKNRIARLGFDYKTLDPDYDVGDGPNTSISIVTPMKTDAFPYDDRMLVAGLFSAWNGAPCGRIMRLLTDGKVDPDFNPGDGAADRINRLNWYGNNTGGWVSGYFRSYDGQTRGCVTRLNNDGSLNTTNVFFNKITALAGWPGMVYSLARQADGKILVGGDFNGVGGKCHVGFARLNPDGSLDDSLRGTVDGVVKSVALDPDGNILLGGAFGQCQGYACTSLARMNPGGGFDQTFKPLLVGDNNSINDVRHVVPLANGHLMIAGNIFNAIGGGAVARLYHDGSLDTAFFKNTTNIDLLPDVNWVWGSRVAVVGEKFLVAGGLGINNYYYNSHGFLIRLNQDGTLDTSFAVSAPVSNIQRLDGRVSDLLLQKDGKILVSGSFTHVLDGTTSPPAHTAIARFTANGLLDNTFSFKVPTWPTDTNALLIPAMGLQSNGRILAHGYFFYNSGGNSEYKFSGVGRFASNGSPDPTFLLGDTGNSSSGYFHYDGGSSILPLPKGKALIGGVYSTYNNTPAWSLVRIFAGQPHNIAPITELLLSP